MRTKAKRDSNEREIIDALISVGASVWQISQPGVPDLLIGLRGVTFLADVKSKHGKLTPFQQEFVSDWLGGEVFIVRTVDDALKAIGATD